MNESPQQPIKILTFADIERLEAEMEALYAGSEWMGQTKIQDIRHLINTAKGNYKNFELLALQVSMQGTDDERKSLTQTCVKIILTLTDIVSRMATDSNSEYVLNTVHQGLEAIQEKSESLLNRE